MVAFLGSCLVSVLTVAGRLSDEGVDIGRRTLRHAPSPSLVITPKANKLMELSDLSDIDLFPEGSGLHFIRSSDLNAMTKREPRLEQAGNVRAMVTVTKVIPKAFDVGENLQPPLPELPESQDQYDEAEQIEGVTLRWVK
ncbi:hypothetical protein RSSM_01762 [Rhodopirellula sallentina SM41]|uniref:Uncharacterized protein n=2 Tax=Rhodopirellula TaxID=265488 RepID=M5U6D4_9BACT|nr:hypothetical protein RSSM_01762 [Rhodopirellula sallentina SM41]